MRREQIPGWVSPWRPFPSSAQGHLASSADEEAKHFGGISKDGFWCWVVRDAALEVFNIADGSRLAAWHFGAVTKDDACEIDAVTDLSYHGNPKLLVGIYTGEKNSIVCLFDVQSSRVEKAISVSNRITSLTMVNTTVSAQQMSPVLGKDLSTFCGLAAVGTYHGKVFLIDLCVDDVDTSDEVSPAQLAVVSTNQTGWASRRYHYINKGMHMCLELAADCNVRDYYYFKKPDGGLIKTFVGDEVYVSCLLYVKQMGSLVVGYSFGCYQIWRMHQHVLEYSSKFEEGLGGITHMAYLEPENDPRHFCYLWAVRQPVDETDEVAPISEISLYQLSYNKLHWVEGIGHVYEGLNSVGPRLDHILSTQPASGVASEAVTSRVVSCYTVEEPGHTLHDHRERDESFDDRSHHPDLSLCVFAWQAWADGSTRGDTYLALFDMNRWYHAQMPHSVRLGANSTHEVCPFFAFCSLNEVMEEAGPDALMSVHLNQKSLVKFKSCMVPPPEQHFFPSSLAFSVSCVLTNSVIQAKFLGLQRQVLREMDQRGPAALVEPNQLFNQCLCTGLLSRSIEHTVSGGHLAQKRSSLLTAALENSHVNFILQCIQAWASGECSAAGCNLKTILDWAWAKVGHIKESVDQLCVPLYDWSGLPLYKQTRQALHGHVTCLGHLTTVFHALAGQNVPITEQGLEELKVKTGVVTLIHQHLEVVLWFVTSGFLPERQESDFGNGCGLFYPAKALQEQYERRRKEVASLHKDMRPEGLLLIDGMVEEVGEPLKALWTREGGDGCYPPPNLHALMVTYLMDSASLTTKHLISMYLMMDLVLHLPENARQAFTEKASQFPARFSLGPAAGRLAEGFWLLDHREFKRALLVLLDPLLTESLTMWQHRQIIKALLYQGHPQMALCYLRARNPPMASPEDVKLKLTVLLANGLTCEALRYQRSCRDQISIDDLLSHVFLACQQTHTVDKLLQLPMTEDEQHHLVAYLRSSSTLSSWELLVLYFLSRGRYIDAIRQNNSIKSSMMGERHLPTINRASARNAIVDRYMGILPAVQRKFVDGQGATARKYYQGKREVSRPKPLSTVVNRLQNKEAVSRAMLVRAVLDKIQEATDTQTTSPLSREEEAPEPFVGTPCTPKVKSRLRETTEVVYPSTVHDFERRRSAGTTFLDGGGMDFTMNKTLLDSPRHRRLSKFMLEKSMDLTGASTPPRSKVSSLTLSEAKSLLSTPPVRKKTPKQKLEPDAEKTPQSILKTRHSSRLSQILSQSRAVTPGQPSFSLANSAFPTPPRIQRRPLLSTQSEQEAPPVEEAMGDVFQQEDQLEALNNVTGTPKLLRFQIPSPAGDSSAEPLTDLAVTSPALTQEQTSGALVASPQDKEEEAMEAEVDDEATTDEEIEVEAPPKHKPTVAGLVTSPASTSVNDLQASTGSLGRPSLSSTTSPESTSPGELSRSLLSQAMAAKASQYKADKELIFQTNRSLSQSLFFKSPPRSKLAREPLEGFKRRSKSPPVESVADRTPTPERTSPKVSPGKEKRTPSPQRRSPALRSPPPLARRSSSVSEMEVVTVDEGVTFQFEKPQAMDGKGKTEEAGAASEPTFSHPILLEASDEEEEAAMETDADRAQEAELKVSVRQEDEEQAPGSPQEVVDLGSESEPELAVSVRTESHTVRGTVEIQETVETITEKVTEKASVESETVSKLVNGDHLVEITESRVSVKERTESRISSRELAADLAVSSDDDSSQVSETHTSPVRGQRQLSDIQEDRQEVESSELSREKPVSMVTGEGETPTEQQPTSEPMDEDVAEESEDKVQEKTPPKSAQKSPARKGLRSHTSQILTPTRRSTRGRETTPEPQATDKEETRPKPSPSRSLRRTPSRRNREEQTGALDDSISRRTRRSASREPEEPLTPSRRGRRPKEVTASPGRRTRATDRSTSPAAEAVKEVPASPGRRTRAADRSASPAAEAVKEVSASPGRRTRAADRSTSPAAEAAPAGHAEAGATPATPTRRGRPKKAVATLSPTRSETGEEGPEVPLTPTRRGRRRKDESVSSPTRSEVGDKEDSQVPLTPTRRSRRKKADSVSEEGDEASDLPSTPSRRGRRKREGSVSSPTRSEVGEEEGPEEYPTPSRRGRKKMEGPDVSAETSSRTESATVETVESMEADSMEMDMSVSKQEKHKVLSPILEDEVPPPVYTPTRRTRRQSLLLGAAVEKPAETDASMSPSKARKSKEKSVSPTRRRSTRAHMEVLVSPMELTTSPSGRLRRVKEKSVSPGKRGTRGKGRSASPSKDSQKESSVSPTRSRRGKSKSMSPSKKESSVSPSRRSRKGKEKSVSPSKDSEEDSSLFPTRGIRRAKGKSVSPSKDNEKESSVSPTRRSRREKEKSVTPSKDTEKNSSVSPTRRSGRAKEKSVSPSKDHEKEPSVSPSRRSRKGKEKSVSPSREKERKTSRSTRKTVSTPSDELMPPVERSTRHSPANTGRKEKEASVSPTRKSRSTSATQAKEQTKEEAEEKESLESRRRTRQSPAREVKEKDTSVSPTRDTAAKEPEEQVAPPQPNEEAKEGPGSPKGRGRPAKSVHKSPKKPSDVGFDFLEATSGKPRKEEAKMHTEVVTESMQTSETVEVVSQQTTEGSTDTQPDMPSFTFAVPMEVSSGDSEEPKMSLPEVPDFVFSPPMTRAKSVRDEVPATKASEGIPPGPGGEEAKEKKTSTLKPKRPKMRKLYPTDDVMLLTPPDEDQAVEETSTRSTRTRTRVSSSSITSRVRKTRLRSVRKSMKL